MLHLLFEKIAAKHPDKMAVLFEDEKPVTYGQLDQLSNQLAHFFLSKGIEFQSYVPVRLDRGVLQVAVLLALLKIGAVYVPVSPEQPFNQLKQIINDCKPSYIVTSSHLNAQGVSLVAICLDKESQQIAEQFTEKPAVDGLSDSLFAYVAYSSGTTGRSKGIPIRHLGMTRYWYSVLKTELGHPVSHVLSNVCIDFDAHVWEYLMAWSFAATLCLTKEETRKDANRLARFIVQHNVSDMTLTPAVLRAFTDQQIKAFAESGLKAIYSTGEACTVDIVARFMRQGIAIFNCYGPTEATFGLSILSCRLEDFYQKMAPIALPPASSPIKIKIVNGVGQEVKEDEAGELVICSPYITPGYLNIKSDKFFVEKTPQGEFIHYKTGDKFIKHHKYLYYMGRAHDLAHVKLRGQLVYPGGVEEVLRQHPDIQDVCVVVRDDLGVEPCLAAFVVSKKSLGIIGLRRHCAQELQIFSIPRYFIFLDKLPLTINGKVNRELLARQAFAFSRDSAIPYFVAKTQLEKHLIVLWEKALDLPLQLKIKIGLKDPFAVLGGDSIKIMLLKGYIEESLQITINIIELGSLEELTIEKLAQIVYAELILKTGDKAIKLVKKGDKNLPPLFLLPPVSGESILTYRKLCETLDCHQEVYAIDAPGLIDPCITTCSIPRMAQSYLALIRTVQPEGSLSLVGWSSGGLLAYEMAFQLEQEGSPAAFVGIVDEPSPRLQQSLTQRVFAQELMDLIYYFKQLYKFSFDCSLAEFVNLPKEQQIFYVFSKASGTLPLVNNLLEYMKIFLLASLSYDPAKLESTPLAVFSTLPTRDKFIEHTKDSTLGWCKYTKLYVMVSELSGNHFSIIESPEELVRIIAYTLQKVVGKSGPSLLPKELKEASEKLFKVAEKFAEEGRKLQSYVTGESPFFASNKNGKAKSSVVISEVLPRAIIQSRL